MFSIQLFFFLICFVCGRDNTTKTEKQTNYSNSKHSQGEKILLSIYWNFPQERYKHNGLVVLICLLEFFNRRDIDTMGL